MDKYVIVYNNLIINTLNSFGIEIETPIYISRLEYPSEKHVTF